MNEKNICFFIGFLLGCIVWGVTGYIINQGNNNRIKEELARSEATRRELEDRLAASQGLIDSIRAENTRLRDAIERGFVAGQGITDAIERAIYYVGLLEKLLDIAGVY